MPGDCRVTHAIQIDHDGLADPVLPFRELDIADFRIDRFLNSRGIVGRAVADGSELANVCRRHFSDCRGDKESSQQDSEA